MSKGRVFKKVADETKTYVRTVTTVSLRLAHHKIPTYFSLQIVALHRIYLRVVFKNILFNQVYVEVIDNLKIFVKVFDGTELQ